MLAVGGVFALALATVGAEPVRFEFRQPHMGSEFKIVLYSPDASTARRASDAAFARIAALDAALSDYDPESELMRLCDRAGQGPVSVSDDLFRVLERSAEFSRLSDGAFDVTVGPVVHLWRRARRLKALPDPEKLAKARALVGYGDVVLDPKARTVTLLKPGIRLDLGGIAKGYAASEALAMLKKEGIASALVAASGDIAVSDPPPPNTRGWRVAIGPLQNPDSTPTHWLTLSNAAVSTSGDAEKFVEIDGRRYSHIVDPKTGLGLVDRSSSTVVARDGATADALATALSVLGPERGLPLIERTEGAAALVVRQVEGKEKTWTSRHWDAFTEARGTQNPPDPSPSRPLR